MKAFALDAAMRFDHFDYNRALVWIDRFVCPYSIPIPPALPYGWRTESGWTSLGLNF